MHRYIVMATAWLEIVVGVIFIAVPKPVRAPQIGPARPY